MSYLLANKLTIKFDNTSYYINKKEYTNDSGNIWFSSKTSLDINDSENAKENSQTNRICKIAKL